VITAITMTAIVMVTIVFTLVMTALRMITVVVAIVVAIAMFGAWWCATF
jgi:hypothetical protein